MKILVTGGAGYIGSILVERLIKKNHDVVVFDNLQQGHRQAVHPKAIFVHGDLSNQHQIQGTFLNHHIDAVIHLASNTLVGESSERPFLYLGDNVKNAINLLQITAKFKVKKFIFSSTANLFENISTPISEIELINPGSPYGESKYIIERMLYWFDKTIGIKYTALRYFNVAGASENYGQDNDPETHLIPLILKVTLGQKSHINIYGNDYPTPDGTCIRDYIHVCDIADAHILALENSRESRCYNLGNGKGYSVQEIINGVEHVTDKKIIAKIVSRREGDPASLVADSSLIKKKLGWEPKYTSLESIIESAWKWHKKHPKGYME